MTETSSLRISRNALAHLLMFAVVMLWGATFVLVKEAIADIAPQWFNALRMMLAFACLALFYRKEWPQLTGPAWLFGAAAGASLACGYLFQTQGLVYTTPTSSAFITALVVVIVPILATLPWLRPPGSPAPGWGAWTGALLALLGVTLLTMPSRAPWTQLFTTAGKESLGNLLTLFCALGFSFYVIVLAHAAGRARFEQLILLQIGFATAFLTAGALLLEPPRPHALTLAFLPGSPLMQPLVLFALGVTAILSTAASFGIQTWAQQVIPASNMAVILTLEPVFAWLTAFAVLGERLQARRGLGAMLVLFGIFAAEILPRLQQRRREIRLSEGGD